ncbi:MAG TPA: MBL fold metallo-hydrolase [Nitrospira sp.]|mgnify:CR=1 FL=1|jgi:glyoxylase-like metal-dependent hydrolase (beta-lactamase superfamily II)|uniref:MBL fold metallo-hydrolase n=1 Tax=Accumulibacter sp. TaxID=2053492 RepID=UPI001A46449E|nr:MBL fold metallo-hydrolase [Accumulibacter sp.]MBL8442343.1 MBL fold metallo-hydrolase [Betaproteobacteria bacterium]HMZ55368.1 MBL fold metallo-hydrolase [Nitrospira sp.]HNM81852.1 MBL fold metallo-hydrolase [Rhodocyclaceae bacterium]HMW56928.1 MBL fold metallo-hydrolase [Accumulibacter sp.]HNO35081.1 MBL fold metallo-hydrolase [Nitrospira sp.]
MSDITDYGYGIYTIDAGYLRPKMAAIHLIESEGRAAFVDTANHAALTRATAALKSRGIAPDCVDLIILTHIHLDHAGGASAMMNAFPNANLVVHPRGVRHMADPSRLVAGVKAVYGSDRAAELYGEIGPISQDRIISAEDNSVLTLGSRDLLFLDTPGHANHHISIVDLETSGVFTGDTFGIAYRELDVDGQAFVFPSTSPSQFDPSAMRRSIDRILEFDPEALYLTHYGQIANPRQVAVELSRRLEESVRIARSTSGAPSAIETRLMDYLVSEARQHGCQLGDEKIIDLWALDIELNAQGLALWSENHREKTPLS